MSSQGKAQSEDDNQPISYSWDQVEFLIEASFLLHPRLQSLLSSSAASPASELLPPGFSRCCHTLQPEHHPVDGTSSTSPSRKKCLPRHEWSKSSHTARWEATTAHCQPQLFLPALPKLPQAQSPNNDEAWMFAKFGI